MIDVTDVSNASSGTEVILHGKSDDNIFTADDIADIIGKIMYEFVCNINNRIARIYIN